MTFSAGQAGLRRIFVPALLMVCSLSAFCNVAAAQDDLGRRALSKKNYPWYNAEADAIERIEMQDRPAVRSGNRNSIPLKPDNVTPATNNWNWNPGSFLGGLSVFVWALIGIVIVGVACLLVWSFLRMDSGQVLVDDQSNRRSIEESIKQLPFELDADSGDFRQAAHARYLAGDYRKAMIYLFSHLLVSLDQKGHIRLRKGKTNRQYLRELRPHRPLSNFYQRVMVPFEATFFGDHELEKKDFENCWNQLDQFQKDVDQISQVAHG